MTGARAPSASGRRRRGGRAHQRGLTLVEMLVVLIIITLMLAAVVMGSGQAATAKLHKSATTLTGLVRVAYVRATVMARSERIVFDIDNNKFWLEESEQPMLVQAHDKTGTGGADPVTEAEKAAAAESDRLIKGPEAPKATFHRVKPGLYAASDNEGGSEDSLPFGIKFRNVQTGHDDDARSKGRAYLYFWPGGLTERASIVLRKGDSLAEGDAISLLVAPLTGRVAIKPGNVALPTISEDKDLSEREDRGTP